MIFEERRQLIDEVRLASNCSHPIRLSGQMVDLATGEISTRGLKVACKDRRQVICPACSALYKSDAWILVSTGLVGGKGVDEQVATHQKLFITLTAPSFGRVHTRRANGSCRPKVDGSVNCPHHRPTICTLHHGEGDLMLGTPLCPECFDYQGAILWNAQASQLFSRTMRQVERRTGQLAGFSRREFHQLARLNYLKVAEMQRRGLVHFHILLRADGADGLEPPTWLTSELIAVAFAETTQNLRLIGIDGSPLRWGSQFAIIDLHVLDPDLNRVANYIAKYAVKTTDGSTALARRLKSRSEIEALVLGDHPKTLALTAWDFARVPAFERLNLTRHANAFGYTGQLITKSKNFSTTFRALREARADFTAPSNEFQTLDGTFHYEGRGYDHPRATELAEVLFRLEQELRQERAQRRKLAPDGSYDQGQNEHDPSPEESPKEISVEISQGNTEV